VKLHFDDLYSLSNNCTKNYYNRTLTVQVIVEDVVTWIFLRHSVDQSPQEYQQCYRPLLRDLISTLFGCPYVSKETARRAFSRAHTSAKAQLSPLITTKQTLGKHT